MKTRVRGYVCVFSSVILTFTVAFLSGCSGLVSANGTNPQLHAAIQVNPASVNFGSAIVGKKVSQNVSVANTGTMAVNISQANLSNSQFSFSGLTLPVSLATGQSTSFQVWFDPNSPGSISGTLTMATDAGVSSEQVALAGTATAVPQQISLNPTSLSLGTITVGSTGKGTATVSNIGGSNLTISMISVSAGPFGVSGMTTPSMIIPGGSSTLNVTYSPTLAGDNSGVITIISNDPQTPTSTIALSGTATTASVVPTITTQPVSQTVTAGQTATFTVVAAGTAPLSYQWQKNGVNIAGATAASYTTPATATSDSGSTFAVVVSNTAGTVASAAATLTVNAAPVAPTIATAPANQTVTAGQAATFTVVAAGTAPLSYQWQKNGVNIAGATAASYLTPVTTTSDNGSTFAVVVSNTAGTVASAAATLTVNAAPVAPTITTAPANQTVTAGQTATFTVVAAGTAPLSYQWQKNGANIAGASSANYTTPATATSDSGSTFRVAVSNTVGTVSSTAATLTVTVAPVAPTITTPPANQTVSVGQSATFTVVAAGTAPLSYQWQKNGANVAGATSASYTTPVTTTSDSGSTFDVIVSNTVGTVTSTAATLTVNAVAPTIATAPVNQTVTAGQAATFTVVAAGTAPLSYQWQKNGANVAGATSTSYTTPATATSDSGSTFRVVVTNTAGTVTSATATLTVNAAPVPGIQVSSSSLSFGNVVDGSKSTQVLVITNTGTATLIISQVTETGSAFSANGFSLPVNVSAGQQTTITVAFQPTAVGAISGNVSIVSNAPTSPTSVGLTGTGIAATPTLGISPTSLSFGNVTTGTTSTSQNATITNTGNSSVTISQINLTGTGYLMTGGSAPVTLTPSQTLTLTVQFGPTAAGLVNGSISIVSNASGSPGSISLSGTGVAPVQHSAALTWNASTSTVSGYNVYRSTVSGGPYTKLNSSLLAVLSYTDTTVQSATTYYYVTTAVDSSGNESANSNEVTASIP